MFVINLTKSVLEFRAHGKVLILQPGLNKVDGTIFNAGELKNHFCNSITFVTENDIEEVKGNDEAPKPIKPDDEVKDIEKPVEVKDAPKSNKNTKNSKTNKTNKK